MVSLLAFLGKNLKILFLVFSLGSFVILSFVSGFSVWLVAYALICLSVFFFIFVFQGGLQLHLFFTLLVFFTPPSLGVFVYLAQLENKVEVEKPLSAEECKEVYEKYNGKSLSIKGEGLIGRADIGINPDDCKGEVDYTFQFSASLSPNNVESNPNIYWGYFVEHDSGEDRKNWDGRGEIFPVYKNAGLLPGIGEDAYEFYGDNSQLGNVTTSFYHWYSTSYSFNDEKYENLFKKTRYTILDGREYLVGDEADEFNVSTMLDEKAAAPVAPIAKEFELTFSET